MSESQTINDLDKGSPLNFIKGITSKKILENDEITVPATGIIPVALRPVGRCSAMELWFAAIDENLAGGQNITVTFYKRIGTTDYTAEAVVVTSPAVTATESKKVDVPTIEADLESYDGYKVSGTVTVAAGGSMKLVVAKKSQGTGNSSAIVITNDKGATIVSTDSAAITEASSTVMLTHKSEVRNTGVNIVYICEGSGTALATDFPIYPEESITLAAGTFDVICGAGLTSTLKILKVS